MAEIGAMTGGLAHEIRNPLSTIGLNADLLGEAVEESSLPDDERSRLLTRIRALRRETERLRGILQDFLEFAGQVHLDRRPADLNEVVLELTDFFAPEAERHRVRLTTQLAPGELPAVVDVRLVKQALLNLMLNAVQAMSPGPIPDGTSAGSEGGAAAATGAALKGELILRTETRRDVETAAAAGGRRRAPEVAVIHVIDTGPGIAPETREKIFKPYFTTKGGGSGLGLPTSRRLIEEHGGRIELHSEPGKGTDFRVVLPLGPAGSGGATSDPSVPGV